MSDAIGLPVECNDPVVELPIVDFLRLDGALQAYVVTFVPEDSVSRAQTEVADIPKNSSEGRRIALQLHKLAGLWELAVPIEQIVHGGGGDFTFRFEGKVFRSLPADSPDTQVTHEAYRCLQDIAMTAQVEYILAQRTPQPVV